MTTVQIATPRQTETLPEPFWSSEKVTLYQGDAKAVLDALPEQSVDCIVTSPPYYGQRNYGHEEQIGLEADPFLFIDKLVEVFRSARRVLKDSGSLWVNIGDTYWSGKGQPKGDDAKNPHRRFLRPQDKTNPHPVCRGKQLLLVPHRFAIAMQDDGWIVRNDIIWHKQNPTPDPVRDRLAAAHEFLFFFVKKSEGYHFDRDAIKVPCKDGKSWKNPSTVWSMITAPTFKKHIAPFPADLVSLPIKACLPPGGVLLDPFCGSATALQLAVQQQGERKAIGIDISEQWLTEAQTLLSPRANPRSRNQLPLPPQ